jgi:hypothetical protein
MIDYSQLLTTHRSSVCCGEEIGTEESLWRLRKNGAHFGLSRPACGRSQIAFLRTQKSNIRLLNIKTANFWNP